MLAEKHLCPSHRLDEIEFGNASRLNSSSYPIKVVPNLRSWIDLDLQPWKSTGITKKMVDSGAQQGMRANRIQIMEKYQGRVMVFDSKVAHKVCPVTSGKRIALVGWASGPPLR